jgi:CarD family transcriptional regulator
VVKYRKGGEFVYKINDYVVYGMQGACQIKDIMEVDFGHKGTLYYKLVPACDKEGEIYVNVETGEKKMRSLVSEDEARRMIKELPKVKSHWIADSRERERVYKQAICEGDYEEIMGIMHGLFEKRQARIRQGKRQTELDDRIFRNTKRVFFGELAVVLDTDIDRVEKEVWNGIR